MMTIIMEVEKVSKVISLLMLAMMLSVAFLGFVAPYLLKYMSANLRLKREQARFYTELIALAFMLAVFQITPRSLATFELPAYTPQVAFLQYLAAFFALFAPVPLMVILKAAISKIKGEDLKDLEEDNNGENYYKILSILLIAPLIEEVVFRKIIGSYSFGYGAMFFIVLSSVIFTLAHLINLDLALLLYTGWGAYIYAWVYLSTGSLWLVVLFHALSNFLMGVLPEKLPKKYQNLSRLVPVVLGLFSTYYIFTNLDQFMDADVLAQANSVFRQIYLTPETYLLIVVALNAG